VAWLNVISVSQEPAASTFRVEEYVEGGKEEYSSREGDNPDRDPERTNRNNEKCGKEGNEGIRFSQNGGNVIPGYKKSHLTIH
jgi:hypothetical protein